MPKFTLRCLLPLLAFSLAARLAAQQAEATFRPALLEAVSTGFSLTARSDLERGGTLGSVAVSRYELGFTGRTPLSEATILLHGLAWARNELDLSGGVLLPGSLQELTASLGVQHRASKTWSLGAYLRPGFYGNDGQFQSDSFNAPLLFTAAYAASRELVWIVGFSANAASDNPFLPIAGVRWQFDPAWSLNVGFPRAGLTWKQDARLSWNFGATVQGGDYYVGDGFGSPAAGIGRLAQTWLEYREIRLGAGCEAALSDGLTLTVDAGVAVDQRFDYFDRGYELKGQSPLFVAVGLKGRF